MNTVGLVLGSGHIGKIHALRLETRGVKCLCVDGKERCLEMLRKPEIGDFDFVLVATPASSHFEYAKRALELGANVFVEKPLATSSAEAKVLVSLARTRERLLFVGHCERFNPAFERFRETFCSEIARGAPQSIDFVRHNGSSLRGRDVSAALDIGVHDFELFFELKRIAPEVSWKDVAVNFDFSRDAACEERYIRARFRREDGTAFRCAERMDAPLVPGGLDPIGREQSEFLELLESPPKERVEKMMPALECALLAVEMAENYPASPNSAK